MPNDANETWVFDPDRLQIQSATMTARGKLKIKFSKTILDEPLLAFLNATEPEEHLRTLNQIDEVLALYVRESGEDEDQDKKIMNYTYDKVENDNRTLSLSVNFEKPSAISADI